MPSQSDDQFDSESFLCGCDARHQNLRSSRYILISLVKNSILSPRQSNIPSTMQRSPIDMFVERNTGARHYFVVLLARAWEVYRKTMQQVSGLARTARGSSMSAGPGTVEI